jgi:hypothetical protein
MAASVFPPGVEPSVAIADQFSRTYWQTPITLSFINKAMDFQFRMKHHYEASKGLHGKDFHSNKDFNWQMDKYSNSHWILKLAWKLISRIAQDNRQLFMTMIRSKLMGIVGSWMLTMYTFERLFAIPVEEARNILDPKRRAALKIK